MDVGEDPLPPAEDPLPPAAPLVEDGPQQGVQGQPTQAEEAKTLGFDGNEPAVVAQGRNLLGVTEDNNGNFDQRAKTELMRALFPDLPDDFTWQSVEGMSEATAQLRAKIQEIPPEKRMERFREMSPELAKLFGENAALYDSYIDTLLGSQGALDSGDTLMFTAWLTMGAPAVQTLFPQYAAMGTAASYLWGSEPLNTIFSRTWQWVKGNLPGPIGEVINEATTTGFTRQLAKGQIPDVGVLALYTEEERQQIMTAAAVQAVRTKNGSPFDMVNDLTILEYSWLKFQQERDESFAWKVKLPFKPLTEAQLKQRAGSLAQQQISKFPETGERMRPLPPEDRPMDEDDTPMTRGPIQPRTTVVDTATGQTTEFRKPMRGLEDRGQYGSSFELRPFLPVAGGDEVLESNDEIYQKKLQYALFDFRPSFEPGLGPSENPLAAANEAEQAIRWANSNILPPVDGNGGSLTRGTFPYGQPFGAYLPPQSVLDNAARTATLRQGIAGRMVDGNSMQKLDPTAYQREMQLVSADPAWMEQEKETTGSMPVLSTSDFQLDRDIRESDTFMADVRPADAQRIATQLGQDIRPRSTVPLYFHTSATSRYSPFMNQYQ